MSEREEQMGGLRSPHRIVSGSLVGAGVVVFLSILGLAYNAGIMSAHVTQLQTNQQTLQAEYNTMHDSWQTQDTAMEVQLNRIEQTLTDMQQQQAKLAAKASEPRP